MLTYIRQCDKSSTDFDYNQFDEFLRGIAGGNRTLETSISIVNDVEDFLFNSPQSSTSNCNAHNLLLNVKSLEQYYHHMKHTMYKPSTPSDKLRRLKLAIKFLIHENHNNTDSSTKGYQIISLLSYWIKSLSKARGKQQQHGLEVMVRLSAELPTKTTENFLNNKHLLLGKVKSAIFKQGFTFDHWILSYCRLMLLLCCCIEIVNIQGLYKT